MVSGDAPEQPRTVMDQDGERWSVVEREARQQRGGQREPCLIATKGDRLIRRIWNYPADWRALSDAELLRVIGAPVKLRGR